MNNELLAMLEYIEQERGISKEQVVKALEQAILSAYRKSAHPATDLNVEVNLRTGELKAWARLKVVEEFPSDDEILLAEAVRRIPSAKAGDIVEWEVTARDFGRIAAQTARQTIAQMLRKAQKDVIQDEFKDKVGEIVTGTVHHADGLGIVVDVKKSEGIIAGRDRIPGVGHGVVAAQHDVGDLGRAEGAGDEQHRVGGPVDDVDVFVTQLADDAVDTRTLHAHAGADGVDAVVIRLDGDLGALTRLADDLLDGDEAVIDLGHLGFKQTLQEDLGGTRQGDHGRAVDAVDAFHDGAESVTFLIDIRRDLLHLGQDQLDVLVVDDHNLALPHVHHFGGDDLADFLLVLLEDVLLLVLRDLGLQVLAQGQDVATAEVLNTQFFVHFFALCDGHVKFNKKAQKSVEIIPIAETIPVDAAQA